MKGALHKIKKTARSNFITEGLLKKKASTDSWGEEIPHPRKLKTVCHSKEHRSP
jgi:hypothetical protein